MICEKCNVEMEKGYMMNSVTWGNKYADTSNPLAAGLIKMFGSVKTTPVAAYKCPKCSEIKLKAN